MFAYTKPEQKQTVKDTIQKKETEKTVATPNFTGIPDNMKTRFENLSGLSFDDVRVHYNSGKPAQLQALAYTQGNQVYIAPGQEKHLGHELGHVVQQKQVSVTPTIYYNGVGINNSVSLEAEADNIATRQLKTILPIQASPPRGLRKLSSVAQRTTEIKYLYKDFTYIPISDPTLTPTLPPTPIPPTTERVGAEMEAKLDPWDVRIGSGTTGTEQSGLMSAFGDGFIRGHLLNHDLGGLAVPENLFPITKSANRQHCDKVEMPVKGLLAKLKNAYASMPIHTPRIEYTVKVVSNFDLTATSSSTEDKFECNVKMPATPRSGAADYNSDIISKRDGKKIKTTRTIPKSTASLNEWFHGHQTKGSGKASITYSGTDPKIEPAGTARRKIIKKDSAGKLIGFYDNAASGTYQEDVTGKEYAGFERKHP